MDVCACNLLSHSVKRRNSRRSSSSENQNKFNDVLRAQPRKKHTHLLTHTTQKHLRNQFEKRRGGGEREKDRGENITTSASLVFARLCFYYILRPFSCAFCAFLCVVFGITTVTYVHVSERGCDCWLHVAMYICTYVLYICMYILAI